MSELRFGLTAPAPCSYLPEQQEQLVFLLPEQTISTQLYQQLLNYNFRRAGEQVYTPHCPTCNACQSVRLDVNTFSLSRSQRRLLKNATASGWHYQLTETPACQDYYRLFEQYISFKHQDGVMYPATQEQLDSMLNCSWMPVRFLEQYYQNQLVAVTVVDETADSYSAVYTFFAQQASRFSPGKLAILYLTEIAIKKQKPYVYLGYYIARCQKMSYKAEFMPQQRHISGEWRSFI